MNKFKSLLASMMLAILFVASVPPSVAAPATTRPTGDITPQPQLNSATGVGTKQSLPMAPGVVLIGLKPGVSAGPRAPGAQASDAALNAAFASLGVQRVEPMFPNVKRGSLAASSAASSDIDLSRIYRLRLPPNADILSAVQVLSADPAVAYAEPDYLAHAITVPNDPLYAGQWGLTQISAPAAWDVVTGTTVVAVAVIDSGLETTHPDLAGQLWTNPGEIAGNGIDDDNDGYIDDVNGANVYNHNVDLTDSTGHGTQVAGIIAAATNNGTGIAGVCWRCRLMVVKVTNSPIANYSDIAAGVAYAAQKGAKVINLSLGGSSDSITLHAAITAASQTAVVVGGAGNDGSNALFYPAAYDEVLGVAGTTITDTKVSTSNYGSWVDVSAPGEAITTTFSGGGYGIASGTSLAGPFASGLAGLLRSQHSDWSSDQVRAQIIHTTDNIDGVNPTYAGQLGSGRINAGSAVTTTATPELNIASYAINGVTSGTPAPGSVVSLTVTLRNNWGRAVNVIGTLATTDPDVAISSTSASFGTVDAYNTGTNIANYIFSVSSSTPYAHALPFSLTVSASGGFNIVLPLTITTQSGVVTVSGTINSNTIWTNDHIYQVVNTIGINPGVTLTIQPGTIVEFNAGKALLIAGTLIAAGTEELPIRFTSTLANPAPGDWDRILFMDSSVDATYDSDLNYTGGSILSHAILEYGSDIYLDDAAPFIASNTLDEMASAEGISGMANGSIWPVIADNTLISTGIRLDWWGGGFYIIRNKLSGAVLYANGAGKIVGNSIWGSPVAGISAAHADLIANRVVNCTEGIVVNSSGLISENLLANNSSNGLRVLGSPTIVSNTIVSNGGTALVVDSGGPSIPHHNNLIANAGQLALRNNTGSGIDGTNNWWGTTSDLDIQNTIWDGNDSFGYGVVTYSPYLSGPEQDAPAYVQSIVVTPDLTLGIQTGTFQIQFSAPMDQSINPVVTFGATQPYTSYPVLDNTQWITNTVWRATHDITSLVPRGMYTVSVSGAKGLDGIEIAPDTRFTFTVDYAGQITDQTPPGTPWVLASGKQGDPSYVEAAWSTSDPESQITTYRYAIGSAAGATDIVNWTNSGATSVTRSGLGLVTGQQYWFSVQAQNVGGLWSVSSYSPFVAGQPSPRIYLPLVGKD